MVLISVTQQSDSAVYIFSHYALLYDNLFLHPGGPYALCTSQIQAAQVSRCSVRAQSQVGHVSPQRSSSQTVTLLAIQYKAQK